MVKRKTKVIEVSDELYAILENIKMYIRSYSYGTLNPSTFEATKFLAERIKRKDLSNIMPVKSKTS